MRLSLQTDLGLRALLYLAAAGDRSVTIPILAEAYQISENHLRKVINTLIHLGLVEGRRGRGGGLSLAKEPSAISVGAVVRLMEPDFATVECLGKDPSRCVLTASCGLEDVFKQALDAWLAVLDRYTLADALRRSAPLGAIFGWSD